MRYLKKCYASLNVGDERCNMNSSDFSGTELYTPQLTISQGYLITVLIKQESHKNQCFVEAHEISWHF